MRLKTASFTLRATMAQSVRWKQAAAAEGHESVGTWAAEALDAHLEARTRAGKPLPLAWSKGRFRVRLEDGTELEVRGWIARPFGFYRGTPAGPELRGCHLYTLSYLPTLRLVATFHKARHCKSLASELVRTWINWNGREPAEDPGALIERHRREDL